MIFPSALLDQVKCPILDETLFLEYDLPSAIQPYLWGSEWDHLPLGTKATWRAMLEKKNGNMMLSRLFMSNTHPLLPLKMTYSHKRAFTIQWVGNRINWEDDRVTFSARCMNICLKSHPAENQGLLCPSWRIPIFCGLEWLWTQEDCVYVSSAGLPAWITLNFVPYQ